MVYPKKEYALYKGDNLLKIGTVEEIAEELGIKKETVSFLQITSLQQAYQSG